jgi:hypothetical protein
MKDSKKWLAKLAVRKVPGGPAIIDRTAAPEGKCELCKAEKELRPYGPKGEWVCFDCGMKDEAAMQRQFRRVVFGENIN